MLGEYTSDNILTNWGQHGTHTCFRTQLPRVWFPALPSIFTVEKIVEVAEVNRQCCLEESGTWLENVDRTHLALAGTTEKTFLMNAFLINKSAPSSFSWETGDEELLLKNCFFFKIRMSHQFLTKRSSFVFFVFGRNCSNLCFRPFSSYCGINFSRNRPKIFLVGLCGELLSGNETNSVDKWSPIRAAMHGCKPWPSRINF